MSLRRSCKAIPVITITINHCRKASIYDEKCEIIYCTVLAENIIFFIFLICFLMSIKCVKLKLANFGHELKRKKENGKFVRSKLYEL